MDNLPLLPGSIVVEHLTQIQYGPDTQALVLHVQQRERGTDYQIQIEVRRAALQQIIAALNAFANRAGTSIEALAKRDSVQ